MGVRDIRWEMIEFNVDIDRTLVLEMNLTYDKFWLGKNRFIIIGKQWSFYSRLNLLSLFLIPSLFLIINSFGIPCYLIFI